MSEDTLLTLEEFMHLVDMKNIDRLKAEIVTKDGVHYQAELESRDDNYKIILNLM